MNEWQNCFLLFDHAKVHDIHLSSVFDKTPPSLPFSHSFVNEHEAIRDKIRKFIITCSNIVVIWTTKTIYMLHQTNIFLRIRHFFFSSNPTQHAQSVVVNINV